MLNLVFGMMGLLCFVEDVKTTKLRMLLGFGLSLGISLEETMRNTRNTLEALRLRVARPCTPAKWRTGFKWIPDTPCMPLHWGGFGGQCRHIWHTWSVWAIGLPPH